MKTNKPNKKVVKEDINERSLFDDPTNIRAAKTWFREEPQVNYRITTDEPLNIVCNKEDEKNYLKFIFIKYGIPYEIEEIPMEAVDESVLKFSDGEEIDTAGPLRADKRRDGWYVVGEGKLIPVKNYAEAMETIKNLKRKK